MRLNSFLDQRNSLRLRGLIGRQQNTAFALIAPDAPGVAADSFPTRESCFYGPLRAGYQGDEPVEELLGAMQQLTDRYPARTTGEPPLLPSVPDVVQGLNFASCDSRALVVAVQPPGDAGPLEPELRSLLWSDELIGRYHAARVSQEEWAGAIEAGRIDGATLESGVFLVLPDPYGLKGSVIAELGPDADREALRKGLHEGFHRFAVEFAKPDRGTHILEGIRKGVTWKEFKPPLEADEEENAEELERP